MNRQNDLDKPVKTTTNVPVPFVVVLELSLEGVAIGGEGLHGRDSAVKEFGELPT